MRLHLGTPRNKGELHFWQDGYFYKGLEDSSYTFYHYPEPKVQKYSLVKMYGVSFRGNFLGVLITRKAYVR